MRLVCLLPLLVVACSRYTGTVAGSAFTPTQAIFATSNAALGANPLNNSQVQMMVVVLSTASGLCADANSNAVHKNASTLTLTLAQSQPARQGARLDEAAYEAGSLEEAKSALALEGITSRAAFGTFERLDGSCEQVIASADNRNVLLGQVNLAGFTAVASGSASLDYDLRIGDQGDPIGGNFKATYCAALRPYVDAALVAIGATTQAPTLPERTCK